MKESTGNENLNKTRKPFLDYITGSDFEYGMKMIDGIIQEFFKNNNLSFFIYFSDLKESIHYDCTKNENKNKKIKFLYNHIKLSITLYESLDDEEKLEPLFFDISIIYIDKNKKMASFRIDENEILFYKQHELEQQREDINHALKKYNYENVIFEDSDVLLKNLNII